MVPELTLWPFDCASVISRMVPSVCLGERVQYLELLLCIHKTYIRQGVSLTRFIHWGSGRNLTNQLQREYWIPLCINRVCFSLCRIFFTGHFTSLGPYIYTISIGPTYLLCPFFCLFISLKNKKQISFTISWFYTHAPKASSSTLKTYQGILPTKSALFLWEIVTDFKVIHSCIKWCVHFPYWGLPHTRECCRFWEYSSEWYKIYALMNRNKMVKIQRKKSHMVGE